MSLIKPVLKNLVRNKKNLIFASIGLVIGICTFVFFVALGAGVKSVVLEDIFVIRQVEVVPRSFDLAITQASVSKLDTRSLNKLAAIPGVQSVYPKMKFAFPAWVTGGKAILGQNFRAEVVADGISTQIVKDELAHPEDFRDWEADYTCTGEGTGPDVGCPQGQKCIAGSCQKLSCNPKVAPELNRCKTPSYCAEDTMACEMPIPVIVNPSMLTVYNASLTTALAAGTGARLPKLTEEAITGFTFDIELGRSYLGDAKQGSPIKRHMQIVGFSEKAINVGLTVPIEYVKRFNAIFTGETARNEYHSVILEASSNDQVAEITKHVKDLGFALDDKHAQAERIGLVITIVTLLFSLISFIIVAISAINISHTFYMIIAERQREIGIMRAIGASKSHIRRMFLSEALILGFFGSVIGVLLAVLCTMLTDGLMTHFIPDFPFKPDSLFIFKPTLIIAAILSGIVFCFVGAWFPASRAANMDPARAFTE